MVMLVPWTPIDRRTRPPSAAVEVDALGGLGGPRQRGQQQEERRREQRKPALGHLASGAVLAAAELAPSRGQGGTGGGNVVPSGRGIWSSNGYCLAVRYS